MPRYVFLLFVAADRLPNEHLIESVRGFCEYYLKGAYELTVVDVTEHPELAEKHRVLATPTLIKLLPLPEQRLVGQVAEEERLLAALGLIGLSHETSQQPAGVERSSGGTSFKDEYPGYDGNRGV